jgi:hypothetical protein
MNTEYKICSACKSKQEVSQFKIVKGTVCKTCNRCLEKSKAQRLRSLCEHGRQKCRCKDCGGKSICEHGRRGIECSLCPNASQICEHGTKKDRCILCGGNYVCEHNKRKDNCRKCIKDIHKHTIKTMLKNSKYSDKVNNRYDQTNFIDYSFVENLIDDSEMKCCYCECKLQNTEYSDTLITIERINNEIGHVKGNCKIACKKCNVGRGCVYRHPQNEE